LGKEILCLHNLLIPREITRCSHSINQHQPMRNHQSLMRQHQSLMLLLRLYITHLLQWCIMPRLPWLMRLHMEDMGDTGILVHTEDMEDTEVIPCLEP
jgi:hypothetical protein